MKQWICKCGCGQETSPGLAYVTEHRGRSRFKVDAGYNAIHIWLSRHHPKTGKCQACKSRTTTQWAYLGIPGRYSRNIDDYVELCVPCHRQLDSYLRVVYGINDIIKKLGSKVAVAIRDVASESDAVDPPLCEDCS